MARQKTNPIERTTDAEQATHTARQRTVYYFSNVGEAQPYSVEAADQEEALRLNEEYVKTYKKEQS